MTFPRAAEICLSAKYRQDIRVEVDELIQHAGFRASARNKRFLAFVVDETLCGRGERIKAYTITVDVFGRGVNFNASLDPIVRIEATRLRLALTAFYAGAGVDAPVRVIMAKGKYIPTFAGAALNAHDDLRSPSRGSDRISALVEVTQAPGLQSSDMIHLAGDLTIESLRLWDVEVLYAPDEGRFAARKVFDDFLKHPGSAFAVDLLASNTSIFWRVSHLASDVVLARERLDLLPGIPASADSIREITDRIARLVAPSLNIDQ